jgi:MFS family permease
MLGDVKAVACGPEKAAFAIACCLAVFDQATASTAIINYAPEVLNSRMGVQDPQLAIMYPAAIALAKVVGTLIAAVTVDKYGRKPLLVWGGVGCGVFLGLTGLSLAARSVALFLAALCLFIFCFSMSWAGLYWVVVSEIFSKGAKSPATSAATSLLFLTGAVVNFVYLSLISWMGGAAFAVFGIIAFGSAWYVKARVPETKGRTLAEIQALLAPAGTAAAGVQASSPGSGSQGLLQPPAGVTSGGGGGSGSNPGSPMLPVSQQQLPSGAPAHAGESRLVELRQVMSKNVSALQ